MAYGAHSQATFFGDWTTGDTEIWNFGVQLVNTTGTGYVPSRDTLLNGQKAAIQAQWALAANGFPSSARLKGVRIANIKPDGTVDGDSPQILYGTGITGGGGSANLPGFCSNAVTFQTGLTVRAGKYGRCYPPNIAPSAKVGLFQIDASEALKNAKAIKALVAALTNGTVGALHVVASKVSASTQPVVYYSCDTLIDTQRRRRNRIVGSRQTAPLT